MTRKKKTATERLREEAAKRGITVKEVAARPGTGVVVFRLGKPGGNGEDDPGPPSPTRR